MRGSELSEFLDGIVRCLRDQGTDDAGVEVKESATKL
jgi:hypothetical protein